jgi:hypothetical protein
MLGSGLLNWVGRGASIRPAIFALTELKWLGRGVPMPAAVSAFMDAIPQALTPLKPTPPRSEVPWPVERMCLNDVLWGPGYIFPGGEIETLRLAKPLGLSTASSLLLLGAGGGGPACSLATKFGAWVTGYEADADLAVLATERALRANLGRRAKIESWDPSEPEFAHTYFHHTMAFEPLRGALPEPLLTAVAAAMKPSGQLVLLELVSDRSLDPADPILAAWARKDNRLPAALPTELSITRVLGRLGFDVRIVEDLSERHMQQAMMGWRRAVRDMEVTKPSPREAGQMVSEAELWLLRMRLFHDRKLRLIRWHAIGR